MTINQRIFLAINEQGKTQKALAEYIGVAPNTVTSWNRGLSTPSIDKIAAIADFLGVSLDYLIRGEEQRANSSDNDRMEAKKTTSKKKSLKRLPEDNDEITYSNNPRDVMSKIVIKHYKMNTLGEMDIKVQSQCPICHYHIEPKPVINFPVEKGNTKDYVVVFWCSHCSHTYSVLYKDLYVTPYNTVAQLKNESFQLPAVDSCYTPYRSAVPDLPKAFNKPEFAKFRQAYEDLCWAKDYQIEGLVGMAYRRAIDFLIRDYFIYTHVDYNGDIENDYLNKLIEVIDEKEIKTFAERVNWLANDYTHYVDDHPDCTIADIEEFFNIILRVLSDNISYNKALQILSKRQKQNNVQPEIEPIAINKDLDLENILTKEKCALLSVFDKFDVGDKGIIIGQLQAIAANKSMQIELYKRIDSQDSEDTATVARKKP